MIRINWNPVPYVGPLPVNWYGITFLLGFLFAGWLVWRWAPRYGVQRKSVESLLSWIMIGVVIGARLYYVVQNDFWSYVRKPWHVLFVWEGGLAYFGGLFGGVLAAFLYCRLVGLPFLRTADLFAPAILIGSAIGRVSCGLDGMDYGTPTSLPWGVVYTNAATYAPLDGVARHPDQFYELAGDLLIAGFLLKMRGRQKDGVLFLLYLITFSILRFLVFFVRGSVPTVALGLNNGQWTALAILFVCIVTLALRSYSSNLRKPGIAR